MQRIEALAKISEDSERLTRTFGSAAMRKANKLVGSWMRAAGMSVRQDAIGNLIGHYPEAQPRRSSGKSKLLILGSHLDTVVNAGKFDGPLGVLVAIACLERLQETGTRLPFAIEVVGFADEEGVRFQSTYLGSRAMAGNLRAEDLRLADATGITMADAIRQFGGNPRRLKSAKLDPNRLLGYVEVHIEQGPVLEEQNLAVGVVTGICGQARFRVRFAGKAGHAGTVPMRLRRDALCAAAEFTLAVESGAQRSKGLVATVGALQVLPGASNVIPGEVNLTLDTRHPDDAVRRRAGEQFHQRAEVIAATRKVNVDISKVHEADSVACDEQLSMLLDTAVLRRQRKVIRLPSGAGHDAAAMAAITPVAMLFVRCKGGISHDPDESVKRDDIAMAISVMSDFIHSMAENG
jgi:allantoate deiminase